SNLILRPPNRDELPNLASLQNAANAKSHLHHLMAPGQFQDPKAYYEWTLLRQRTRFVTPFLRFIIAEDAQTNEILGLSLWSAQGESALRRRWESAGSIFDRAFWGMERALLDAEMKYNRYILGDKIIDYDFVNRFVCAAHEAGEAIPPCLHLWVLMTAPAAQGKGVGKALMDRGKTLARQEGLSLILESNLEAVGFYEKMGMK
ncbi:acyl-CoA N-acyltransferase, partial [Tothia fuscella]